MGKTFSTQIEPLLQFFHIFPTMDTEKKIALIIDCDNAKWPALIRATEYFEEGKNSKGQQVSCIKKR